MDETLEQSLEGIYKKASAKVELVLPRFKGMVFTREEVYRECGIFNNPQHKDWREAVSKVLYNISDQNKERVKPLIKQTGRNAYRLVNYDVTPILWQDAKLEALAKINFPLDYDVSEHDDRRPLVWASDVNICPKDIIVVAGESNMGKSCFCMNMAIENMDNMPVTLWISEGSELKVARRLEGFRDKGLIAADGTPKFEILRLDKDPADAAALRPDSLWNISKTIENIEKSLDKGVAVVAIQKADGQALGRGGGFSRDWASLYLTLSKLSNFYLRMKIEKVKDYNDVNVNGKEYRFTIVDKGAHFSRLEEIEPCKVCHGTGVKNKVQCTVCEGNKYTVVGEEF
jgi:hypothetical protein